MNQKIIEAAYARPRFSTDQYRNREVVDFENEFYGTCLKLKAAGAI